MKKTKTAGSEAPANQSASPGSFDWSKVGTSGFEQVQQDDLGMPFLAIVQDGSPEFKKSDPKYQEKKIVGCGPGDIFNTLSREVVYKHQEDHAIFIPCSYEKLFMEWKPREEGGGLVKAHKNATILNECQRSENGQDTLRTGNIIVTTAYFYGLLLHNEEQINVVIGFKSTQLGKARALLNIATSLKLNGPNGKFTPPLFSHSYEIGTGVESNNKGSWYGWTVALHEPIKDPLLIANAIETAKRSSNQQRAALPPAPEAADNVPFA